GDDPGPNGEIAHLEAVCVHELPHRLIEVPGPHLRDAKLLVRKLVLGSSRSALELELASLPQEQLLKELTAARPNQPGLRLENTQITQRETDDDDFGPLLLGALITGFLVALRRNRERRSFLRAPRSLGRPGSCHARRT